MGDYVLESNPALERLIERYRAPVVPLPPEESARSRGHAKRSRREKRHKAQTADHPEVLLGDSNAGGRTSLAERMTGVGPMVMTEEDGAIVEGNFWAIDEDLQAPDEMLLIDFDEEPEVFDEDFGDSDEDEDDDEGDEVLDLYEDLELDDVTEEGGVQVHGEVVDAGSEVLEENGHGGRDWIFDAFEAWKLEVVEAGRHDQELTAFDDEAEPDEFIDDWSEDAEEPVRVRELGWPIG